MKQRKQTDFTILLLGIVLLVAILAASCNASKNYKVSPCWKGAEPKHRYGKMRA